MCHSCVLRFRSITKQFFMCPLKLCSTASSRLYLRFRFQDLTDCKWCWWLLKAMGSKSPCVLHITFVLLLFDEEELKTISALRLCMLFFLGCLRLRRHQQSFRGSQIDLLIFFVLGNDSCSSTSISQIAFPHLYFRVTAIERKLIVYWEDPILGLRVTQFVIAAVEKESL